MIPHQPGGPANRASWRSIVGVAALTVLLLAVANLAPRDAPQATVAGTRFQTAFGWPLTYSLNDSGRIDLWMAPDGPETRAHGLALAANLATLAALVCLSAWLWSLWRRRRAAWFQFGLFDILIAMSVSAAVLALGLIPYAQMQRERKAERLLNLADQPRLRNAYSPIPTFKVSWRPAGLSGFRLLGSGLGSWRLREVIRFEAYGENLSETLAFRSAEVAVILDEVSQAELNRLRSLPKLRILVLSQATVVEDRGGWVDSPDWNANLPLELPQITELYADNCLIQGSDLAGCTGLKYLELTNSKVDDASLRVLAALPNLTTLVLDGSTIAGDVTVLRSAPRLSAIYSRNCQLTAAQRAFLDSQMPRTCP